MYNAYSFSASNSNNPFFNYRDDSSENDSEYESSIEENKMSAEEFLAVQLHGDYNKKLKNTNIYKILPFLAPYIRTNDAFACATVNKKFNTLAHAIIWENPNFKELSHIHDELYMFNKFLEYLPLARKDTLNQIKTIDVSNIEQSLYEQVKPNFFQLITQYCENLESLNLSKADYFNRKSLPRNEYWQLPHLTRLDLSHCSQMNDDLIVIIARGARNLEYVRLDHLPRHKGKGLACIAAECDKLKSVSVRHNTLLEDQALIALGKFRHIRLEELDITGCKKITSVGFEVLARYAAHLKRLSLAQTSCRLSDLRKFVCISRRTTFLDISSCKKFEAERHALAEWIWNTEFHELEELVMDSSVLKAIFKISQIQLIDVLLHVRQVRQLTVTNLPEHTPLAYFHTLLEVFPLVKYVIFKRAYFETDFMLGTYRTPSPEDEEYITDMSLQTFNGRQSRTIAKMIHERENDIDCSPMNW